MGCERCLRPYPKQTSRCRHASRAGVSFPTLAVSTAMTAARLGCKRPLPQNDFFGILVNGLWLLDGNVSAWLCCQWLLSLVLIAFFLVYHFTFGKKHGGSLRKAGGNPKHSPKPKLHPIHQQQTMLSDKWGAVQTSVCDQSRISSIGQSLPGSPPQSFPSGAGRCPSAVPAGRGRCRSPGRC